MEAFCKRCSVVYGNRLGFTSPKGETALERVMTLTDAMLDERVEPDQVYRRG